MTSRRTTLFPPYSTSASPPPSPKRSRSRPRRPAWPAVSRSAPRQDSPPQHSRHQPSAEAEHLDRERLHRPRLMGLVGIERPTQKTPLSADSRRPTSRSGLLPGGP